MVMHDFAYGDVCFDGYQAPSFLSVPGAKEVGVETSTMSKGYNMAGWRIGFCAGNAEMVRALATIKGYYDYGDRKSVVKGKSVDLGGRRIIKKKKRKER